MCICYRILLDLGLMISLPDFLENRSLPAHSSLAQCHIHYHPKKIHVLAGLHINLFK